MQINSYIEKIVNNGKPEDMEELSEILEDLMYIVKDYDEDYYKKYKMKLYEMANGKILTKNMAEEWVKNMKPMAKWDYDTTVSVKNKYGINDIDDVSFYVVMNMLYSDMNNVLGNGDTQESIENYVTATRDWLNDEDIGKDKLYDYWRYVAK